MKLFDGSEDYEIRDYSVHVGVGKPVHIHVNLSKDTTCSERLETNPGELPRVVNAGKRRDHPEINQYSLELWLTGLGRFKVHPNSLLDHERLKSLFKTLETHPKATLGLAITMNGDNNQSQVDMEPFMVRAVARSGQWAHMFNDYTRIVG